MWTLAVAGIVVVAVAAVALYATAVAARHRAESAADLAALAAATSAWEGTGAACDRAAQVAAAGGGRVVRCVLAGRDAVVEVQVRPAGPVGRLGRAAGRARAGPDPPP